MRKVYISGSISKNPAFKIDFESAERKLNKDGFKTLNPCSIDHSFHDQTWESFMKEDLIQMIQQCNFIFMIKGWEKSRGARLEYQIAKKLHYFILKEKNGKFYVCKPETFLEYIGRQLRRYA